jgi:NTP pyrophosphatase (non-canonical NTP hydrolase)
MDAVQLEFDFATEKYPAFNTAHEGWAVLLEEVDELWDHVKVKQGRRDLTAMQKEAIQIAAMALRFAFDMQGDRGQK